MAMINRMTTRPSTLAPIVFCALALAACGGGAAASPSAAPTPTPTAGPAATAAEAAALVIATNPLFAGALELDANLIGASKWWVATPNSSGGYTIVMTVGWGDCPAGCISRHTWTFEVGPDGGLSLVSESGEAVPSVLPA